MDSLIDALVNTGSSDDEDTTGAKKNATTNKRQAGTHATYMRFWRTINENKAGRTPEPVIAKARAAKSSGKSGRGMFTYLFEEWQQAGGDWMRSTIMINHLKEKSQRRIGKWKDMTEAQLVEKYGDEALVKDLMQRKIKDGMSRAHPDFPGQLLFKCFDATEYEEEEKDSVSESLRHVANLDSTGAEAAVVMAVCHQCLHVSYVVFVALRFEFNVSSCVHTLH
jgi:hypothetical protein